MTRIGPDSRGVYIIAATPFTDTLEVDGDGIDRVTDFYLEKGADGITVLGMMGEAPKLTPAESVEVVKRTIARAQGKPVVVGVSAAGFVAMRNLARQAMDLGAAGVMVAPAGTKTDRQIRDYYANAVEAIGDDIPLVLQDFPLATGINIDTDLMIDIFTAFPSIVMLKHEDWPGLTKISRLREAEARIGRRLSILVGNGGMFLAEELARGADGAMTGFGYPEMMVGVCRAAAGGDLDRAQDLFDAYLPLARYEQQPGLGLAIRKYLLHRRGAIGTPRLRNPGATLGPRDIADIERLVARQDKRLATLG